MGYPVVLIDKLGQTSELVKEQILSACSVLSLSDDFRNSKAVFVKPNLTYPLYKKGVTTQKTFIENIVSVLRKVNSTTRIYIGEGEGGYNGFAMDSAFEKMGFREIERNFTNVKVINLSKMPSKEIKIITPQGQYKIELPEIFFTEIDFSITCPVPKVHCMTKISLSYKNQWGCIPDVMRLKYHYRFDYFIPKISDILKFKYALLDGKYGLDKNGPMAGNPVEVNWFVASNSLGAFDMIVAKMMGFDWKKVGHLEMASKYGFIPKIEDIKISGDIENLRRKFVLKRDLWNYPGLFAFRSKKLTHFFYCSKYAKVLHDFMYTFRKRSIEQ